MAGGRLRGPAARVVLRLPEPVDPPGRLLPRTGAGARWAGPRRWLPAPGGSRPVSRSRPGFAVTGVEPGAGMIAVARSRPGAERVHWIHAPGPDVRDGNARFRLAYMTGHAFQAVHTSEAATALLANVARHLAANGEFHLRDAQPARPPVGALGWRPLDRRERGARAAPRVLRGRAAARRDDRPHTPHPAARPWRGAGRPQPPPLPESREPSRRSARPPASNSSSGTVTGTPPPCANDSVEMIAVTRRAS